MCVNAACLQFEIFVPLEELANVADENYSAKNMEIKTFILSKKNFACADALLFWT
jgi:hypothetical protein